MPDGGALWATTLRHPNSTSTRTVFWPTVVRLDSVGNVVWQRQYGEPYGEGNLYTIVPVPDGSYLLTGYQSRPVPGPGYLVSDAWVLRINGNGDTLRSRYIQTGPATTLEIANSAQLLPNGGVLLGGLVQPGVGTSAPQPAEGWVAWLDSLDRLRTSYVLPPGSQTGGEVTHALPLAGPDSAVLLTGYHGRTGAYLARYTRRQGQVQASWSQNVTVPNLGGYSVEHTILAPNQELTLGGMVGSRPPQGVLTRFVQAGQPYQPDLCRQPPVP
ncbi:hypothetical protein, partial [Hymenobacter saemangeumensis]|uniref:hypothetical protein n=1 Tax=Hymenobacter saemangeumensis TaxID=1084522 RepID=UPI0031E718D0